MNPDKFAQSVFRLGWLVMLVAFVSGCEIESPYPEGIVSNRPKQPENEQVRANQKLFDTSSLQDRGREPQSPASNESAYPIALQEVSQQLGIDFVYQTGAKGKSLMVETMGGGCGAIDFDSDGLWDLVFPQGGDPTASSTDQSQPNDALFRQLSDKRFVDIAAHAFPNSYYRYGEGVTIGDIDDDGFDDIYFTNVGSNQLLRNMGDGTFVDITESAGVGDERWSTSAAFADLDGDGLLDLYVCNYVVYDPHNPMDCRNEAGEYRICHPREMDDFPDTCFVNQGDGSFRSSSVGLGLTGEGSKGLGVAIADFNDDRLPDIYVANDTTANFLFINQGDGLYQESALLMGCAMNRVGQFQASMGLGIGDFNGDGRLDIYATHFYDESNTLYANLGPGGFEDVTAAMGLHAPTIQSLGFGAVMEDLNHNGRPEIFVTNGHIENYEANQLQKMQPQLFTFQNGKYQETGNQAGSFFHNKYVGRGVCTLDLNSDGALDLVVVHQDQTVAVLENQSTGGNWLNLMFRGRQSNRRGIGCHATVQAGEMRNIQQLYAGGSYASSRQPILSFGLAAHSAPVDVEVVWPSGKVQQLSDIEPNQTLIVDERHAR